MSKKNSGDKNVLFLMNMVPNILPTTSLTKRIDFRLCKYKFSTIMCVYIIFVTGVGIDFLHRQTYQNMSNLLNVI